MRINWKTIVRCLVVLAAMTRLPGCVNVQDQGVGRPALQPLGVSNGYVLLHYPDGKFYIVKLDSGDVREVSGLPKIPD